MTTPSPALPMTPALAERLSGQPLMLLLDVDGTLSPIAPRPAQAIIPPDTCRVLTSLVALPRARVVLISGRAADDARSLVGVGGVWVIGNHGLELAAPNQPVVARDDVAVFAGRIAAAGSRAREIAERESGVIVEDKRWTLSIHYRLAHPRIVSDLSAKIAEIARDLGLMMTRGKEVLELRPPVNADKGTAAVELASKLGALHAGASLLCAGDDRTDEDAFRALRAAQPRCVTVHVDAAAAALDTAAEFHVPDTTAMRELLEAVLALHQRGTAIGVSTS